MDCDKKKRDILHRCLFALHANVSFLFIYLFIFRRTVCVPIFYMDAYLLVHLEEIKEIQLSARKKKKKGCESKQSIVFFLFLVLLLFAGFLPHHFISFSLVR